MRLSLLIPIDDHDPLRVCVHRHKKREWYQHSRAHNLKGFCTFRAAVGRLCSGIKPGTGTFRMMGFGVIESPVGVVQRTAKGFELERLLIDSSDAPDAWLREAEKLVNSTGLACLRPSTFTKKHSLNTNTHNAPM